MHTLFDNSITISLGTPGLAVNGGTFGAPAAYTALNDADYINFVWTGTFSAATGTVNVFQGTTSAGAAAKLLQTNYGTATVVGTAGGTAWGITVQAAALDVPNGFTFVNAVGTVASGGSVWQSLIAIKTSPRVAPGTNGLNGSAYVVA